MFSRWSPIYEEEVAENAYSAADEVAKAAIKYLAQDGRDNPAIADIGIGTGLLAQQLYDALPCRITGIDFTEDMMASCAGRDITELLIKCDAGKDPWPLQDGTFDMVVSSGLFEYLTDEMVRHFIMETKRVLRSGGWLVFTYMPVSQNDRKVTWWHGHSGSYLTCGQTPGWIESELNDHGFEVADHTSPFKGCIFQDGSSYDYRRVVARKI